jgi:hypothetical protein
LCLDAKINGKRATLAFDSGTSDFVLWRQSAERFGLEFSDADASNALAEGVVPSGMTEVCVLSMAGKEGNARFHVLNPPQLLSFGSFDGLVGWRNVRKSIFEIDASRGQITFFDKLPKRVLEWTRFAIVTNSSTLRLVIPDDTLDNGVVCVDTGSQFGIGLPSHDWLIWKSQHRGQPTTLASFVTVSGGPVAREESWARQFALGPLLITSIPVLEERETESALGESYKGSLGLAALKRLELVIDGKNDFAYLRARSKKAPSYPHNRAGVIFLPDPISQSALVAHVVVGSPAYEAGVRNGDLLKCIDEFDNVTTSEIKALKRFWQPAGTEVNIKIIRDGKIFSIMIMLRDILGTATANGGAGRK